MVKQYKRQSNTQIENRIRSGDQQAERKWLPKSLEIKKAAKAHPLADDAVVKEIK